MENDVGKIAIQNLIAIISIILFYEFRTLLPFNYCDLMRYSFSFKWIKVFFLRQTPVILFLQFFKEGCLKHLISNEYILFSVNILIATVILLLDCRKHTKA